MEYKFTYKFQPSDHRDHTFHVKLDNVSGKYNLITIKKKVQINTSLNKTQLASSFTCPLGSILDQGNLGSCVANAFSYTINAITKNKTILSRLWLYAMCRILDNVPLNQDSGTYVRSAGNALLKYGAVPEPSYPYTVSLFGNFPPLNIIKSSNQFTKFGYIFVNQDLVSLKTALVTNNRPIIFGFLVYSSFTASKNGNIPMPNTVKETLLGGHCMTIVGYNDTNKTFKCANSWGTFWGDRGYCYIPYGYLTNSNLASDFCYINLT